MKAIRDYGVWGVMVLLVLAGCGRGPEGSGLEVAGEEAGIRMLLVGDPFAMAMTRMRGELEAALGERIELEIVGYNDVRRLTLLNARDRVSNYDLVAFDVVWLGEYVRQGVLYNFRERVPLPREAFLTEALEACELGGGLYGLPIQPHAELLWVREDWLEEAGMELPVTTEDVLAVARALHDPARQRYGVAWNAQRGQPLGQTMAHLFAAFGAELVDGTGRPGFRNERGLAAARYAMALLAVSPPDIHSMAWDQRTGRFASGQVAMTYGWGARAYMAEEEAYSLVKGKVAYLPAPHAPGVEAVTPLGVWALGIPANVRSVERSLAVLEGLFDVEVQRQLSLKGNAMPGLRVLARDPGLQERYRVLRTMSVLDEAGAMRVEVRPRIPEWDGLCEILGTVFHDMLLGGLSPEAALDGAFEKAEALLAGGEGGTGP